MAPRKTPRPKPWSYGGDSIYKRGRSWVLDFQHKGPRGKEYSSIPLGFPA